MELCLNHLHFNEKSLSSYELLHSEETCLTALSILHMSFLLRYGAHNCTAYLVCECTNEFYDFFKLNF